MECLDGLCPKCLIKVQPDANFCHSCGEPLTELAQNFYVEKRVNAQLTLLASLLDSLTDPQDLLILRAIIEKLSE